MNDIQRVLTVYRGIASRDKDLALRFLHPTRYTQHNPHAADGIDGVKGWIDQQPEGESPLDTVRAFQDGPFVFSHTVGDAARPFVFMDIFHFEKGLAIEHWVVWTDIAPPNKSGHSQIDGPTQAEGGADTQANKALVRTFYQTILVPQHYDGLSPYFAEDRFIQHDPDGADGVVALRERLETATRQGRPLRVDEPRFVLGQGDFVLAAAKGALGDDPAIFFDLYRVEDGKLAEHWGVTQKVPPREQWKNSNGML